MGLEIFSLPGKFISHFRGKGSSQSASEEEFLVGNNDKYDGVIVEPSSLPSDPSKFEAMLKSSLAQWKSESKKGIWLKIPRDKTELAPIAFKEGFVYHHAEKDYVMLTCWISDGPCTLPANASHQVGIGAMVIDDNKILVVQEATGPTKGSGNWKIPTGVVHQGEDINEAAEREVKEETGVDAEFVEVLGVRQTHTAPFGKSDIFFLCLLRPKSKDVVKQDTEIEAVQWMPVEEYRSQEFNARSELMKRFADIITALSICLKGSTQDSCLKGCVWAREDRAHFSIIIRRTSIGYWQRRACPKIDISVVMSQISLTMTLKGWEVLI